jgi:excisionase family DNA binding protein
MAEPPENILDALLYQPSLVYQLEDAESRDALQKIAERASALKALESQIISRLVFDRAPSAQGDFPHLLTAKQIAEHLAVPESWVREQARIGALPSIKLGHYVRFRLDDVNRHIHQPPPRGRPGIRPERAEELWPRSESYTDRTVREELAGVLTAWTTVLWAHAVHENGFFSRLKRRLKSTSPKPS